MKIIISLITLLVFLFALGCDPESEDTPSAYVVSGADAVTAGVDGTYTLLDDSFNSKPQYGSTPVGLVIFFGNSDTWLIFNSIEQMTVFQNTDQDEYPPESGWTTVTGAAAEVTLTPEYN